MLSQQQIDHFHQTGFLKIPGVFSGEELTKLQDAAAKVVEEGIDKDGEQHLYRKQPDGSEQYFRSEKMWHRDEIFRIATVKPELLAAVAQCIGHPFLPMNDSLVVKTPHSKTPIPFHQDPPYFKEGYPTSTVPDFVTDVYLDHSTIANGCVHGIPERHLAGTIDLKQHSEDSLFNDFGAVPMEMKPCDVLFHALSAPHGSRDNPTDQQRRTFYLKFQPQCIPDSKSQGTRTINFNEEGITTVKNFLSEREQAGYQADLGPDLHLDADGFHWTGEARSETEPWGKLQERIGKAGLDAMRELGVPA